MCLCNLSSVPKYSCTISFSSKTDSHYFFSRSPASFDCLYCLPPTIFFSFCYWMGKGVTSFQDPPMKPWELSPECCFFFFCLEWAISLNSLSGKVEPFFYFSYFCLRPACGPEKLAVADENLTWWYRVRNFTRVLYEVVRPESLLAEGKKASSLGAAGSAWLCYIFIQEPTYPGKSCATLATSLCFSRALR